MNESFSKSLIELREAGIIDTSTEEKIRGYYLAKQSGSSNRAMIVFSILGALLVGLGIILIVAHNWDDLGRTTKTIFAFIPLVIGQAFCGFALLRKRDRPAWIESTSAFLFYAVAACFSLVSQIYNIEGSLSSFLFTWMLLCIPIVYVMQSSTVSLLYIGTITWYGVLQGYWESGSHHDECFWILLLLIVPFLYLLAKNKRGSPFFSLHHFFIAISISIMLGTLFREADLLAFPGYMILFGIFLLAGDIDLFKDSRAQQDPASLIGSIGSLVILLILSFSEVWEELYEKRSSLMNDVPLSTLIVLIMMGMVALGLLYRKISVRGINAITLPDSIFILFIIIYLTGFFSQVIPVLFDNLLALALGIYWLRKGIAQNHLGILNYGLLIIAALATCRFFDVDLSFVIRGIMFVGVGVLFFAANYITLKKRKQRPHEK